MPCDRHGAWGSSGGARNPEAAPPASSSEAGALPAVCLHLMPGMLLQPPPMSCPSMLPPGSQPRPQSFLFFLGTSTALVPPPWNPAPATLIVSGLGARDPSPQLGCIPSRTQPPSHIPERSQCPGGPTQAQDTPSLATLPLGVLCLQPMG